jgi:sugar/nucleoside kinase (ribokinase family)
MIVGSVALDDVKTPLGEVKDALGGSAVYSALAASYFSHPGIVGVVGQDFPDEHLRLLRSHTIELDGVEKAQGRTFHWSGYYEYDMGTAFTTDTQLNVFAQFSPKIPAQFRETPFVFLANIDPELQLQVLAETVGHARFTMLDTMNYWIQTKREKLMDVIRKVDMVVVNDAEIRQLSGESNLIRAAQWIGRQGPRGVIVKKGEHGAFVLWEKQLSLIPAFPLDNVKDPTGAGDTFAGGFIGALSRGQAINAAAIRSAAVMGVIMASFTVEDFSVGRLAGLQEEEIVCRHRDLRTLTALEELATNFSLRRGGRL